MGFDPELIIPMHKNNTLSTLPHQKNDPLITPATDTSGFGANYTSAAEDSSTLLVKQDPGLMAKYFDKCEESSDEEAYGNDEYNANDEQSSSIPSPPDYIMAHYNPNMHGSKIRTTAMKNIRPRFQSANINTKLLFDT